MIIDLTTIKDHLTRVNHARLKIKHLWRGLWNIVDAWPPELFEHEFVHQRILFRDVFFVSAPDDVEYVMVTRVENFPKSDVTQQMLKPLIGDSMFITHGEHWKRQRRIATPAFHSRHIREFTSVMVAQTRNLLDRWREVENGGQLDITREMTRLTAEIICSTLFSDDISRKTDQVYDAFARYQKSLGRLALAECIGFSRILPRLGTRAGLKAASELDSIVYEIIERRRKSGDTKHDLLSILLDAEDPETGAKLSERLVRDELLFLFLAGHETTASATIWTWYLLSQHPEAEARLHEEVDEVLGDRDPTYDDISRMEYVRAVLLEAMRLYPPVHTYSRQCVSDDVIRGERVPTGALVVISPWIIQRHKKIWENPDKFQPERFLGEHGRPYRRFDYIPFSAGPRTCLGLNFAMTEMGVAVSMISQRYRLRLKTGHPVSPMGFLTLRPKHGLPMTIHARR